MTQKTAVIFTVLFALLSMTHVFGAGQKDANGLQKNDYDKNGWAIVNGRWVASPDGAVYRTTAAVSTIEVFAVQSVEAAEADAAGFELAASTEKTIVYDKNGWAYLNGKWMASPDGALYRGQEHRNLAFAITGTVNSMGDAEKGMLKAALLYGKDMEKKAGDIINSPERLAEYGKDVSGEWVAEVLDKAFTKGTGFMDELTGRSYNYGKQLDMAIQSSLVKSFGVSKPKFTTDANTLEGALQREQWIVDTFLDVLISNMTEAERMEFIMAINEELIREGVTLGQDFMTAFSMYGIAALTKRGKFITYTTMSHIVKQVSGYILHRNISWAVYQTISTVAKRVFGMVIPGIGIIFTAKMIFDIPGVINPREYDKFVPAVLFIGMNRAMRETGEFAARL